MTKRLFEREANFFREVAYSSYKIYKDLWNDISRREYEEDVDCPEANRAYQRAMNLQSIADLLDPRGKYNFYFRYYSDARPKQEITNEG